MKPLPSTSVLVAWVLVLAPLMMLGGACTSANVSGVSNAGCGGNDGGGNAGGTGGAADTGRSLVLVVPDAGPVDACVPLSASATCAPSGGPYCGVIGDGCNGEIDCGNNCPTGWSCDPTQHTCVGGADCNPTYQCTYAVGSTSGSYCGKITDGCGHALACGDNCASANPGWTCENSLCVGGADVCTPATCDPVAGARYCGQVGDGCGRGIDCGDNCASLNAGWMCNTAINSCVGGPGCKKLVCDGADNFRYCGKVGDGCGGTVDCGDTCSTFQAGWVCDQSKGL